MVEFDLEQGAAHRISTFLNILLQILYISCVVVTTVIDFKPHSSVAAIVLFLMRLVLPFPARWQHLPVCLHFDCRLCCMPVSNNIFVLYRDMTF